MTKESDTMVSEKIANEAMQIILHAGDARAHCTKAIKAIEKADFDMAKEEMELANQDIIKAHKVQTSAIQGEARGEEGEYSILFVHAQDTLMTVYSEMNIAKRLIRIFDAYEQRIAKLEQALIVEKEEH